MKNSHSKKNPEEVNEGKQEEFKDRKNLKIEEKRRKNKNQT